MSVAFQPVIDFERQVADFAGARYGVAVATGTWAIFLSLQYYRPIWRVFCPAKTYISVPMAIMQAGARVEFTNEKWKGIYQLKPLPIIDGALRWKRGMYWGGLHCLSFHAHKNIPIGDGGMILTNDRRAADWLRAARYAGRTAPDYAIEKVKTMGWQAYMPPESAARGLRLMDNRMHDMADQKVKYADLRKVPFFKVLA